MEGSLLLPLGNDLVIEQISREAHQIIISISSTTLLACCPLCSTASESVHSHYRRTVADLPEVGQFVILKLTVRRFFCRNTLCARRIFTERLPELVQPWAQMTKRLREALRVLSFATCAEAGSRLAHLGMKGSPSTLLRCQRAVLLAEPEPFTKVGIDDFAFRRGRTYGTIIVNLETHRLIDLLPDRTVETVSSWLAAHPEIELISRDRASDYATAATLGAPQAPRVCNRWHLLKNLSEQVVTFLARMRVQIRQTSTEQAPSREEDSEEEARWQERETSEQARDERRAMRREQKTVRDQIREIHQAERLDRYQQILQLASQGLSSNDIAARVGLSARSVRQWLAEGIKTSPRRRRPSPLDTYASYLQKRWEEGEQQGARLYQELLEKGYAGSERAVHRYLGRWRSPRTDENAPGSRKHRPRKTAPPPGPFDECQAKQAVWLYMRTPEKLKATEKEQLAFLKAVHPSLETVYELVQTFLDMIHNRKGEQLERWLDQIRKSHIPELIRFGKGIERDKPSVLAALTMPYSNGIVEGHVHRLKLMKRQGYGRASFNLLRQRVLYQAV